MEKKQKGLLARMGARLFPQRHTFLQQAQRERERLSMLEDEALAHRVADVIAARPTLFTGLYGPILRNALGDLRVKAAPFQEWRLRARTFCKESALHHALDFQMQDYADWDKETYMETAQWLLACFALAGILRDESAGVTLGLHNLHEYVAADGTPLRPGETYLILAPCWRVGNQVVERGIVRSMK